ncbi:MAG TPA: FAD-linked oxidase C-terminal domain-containing protein [Solirubrobacteraceae bacterium]|nr:FAD-linked oxidase C-terminal domain-containing protein [Solirubrobacteraceae bacterium]
MLEDLARIVGSANVRRGDDPRYVADQTAFSAVHGVADAVALPADAGEVAELVAWCDRRGVPVVPRGGGTGWAGGAVPLGSGVVIGLERLTTVRSVDPLQWRMEVEAGVTTATVQRLARENGLCFPPDPGAAETSQIGGNVATNAGGPHCFKYGVTGAWVTGVEAVLAPGELVRVGGPARKDVAGYDLRGLLVGSEGTLGIITAVWLRLMPAPAGAWPVAAFYDDAEAGGAAVERLMAAGPVPAAIEYLDAGALALAGGGFPGGAPEGAGFLVIAESDTGAGDAAALADALEPGAVGGVRVVDDPAGLWRWRDGVGLVVTAERGGKLSDDIAVPVERLADAVAAVAEIGERHGLPSCSWGHAGDGNLHATFLVDPRDDLAVARARHAADDLLATAIELGGTISGEHGIGVLKNGWLRRQWEPAAVAAHEAVKGALDPHGLMNPGKKVP